MTHAFDENPPFRLFVQKLNGAGMKLVIRQSWRAQVPERLEGHNHCKGTIETMEGLTICDVFVEGFGQQGFAIYYGSGRTSAHGEVEYLRNISQEVKGRTARVEIAMGEMARDVPRHASIGRV